MSLVLILVLVEDGLGGDKGGFIEHEANVLILVLVEDGLGAPAYPPGSNSWEGLNPCFSGGWSRSPSTTYPPGSNSWES